VRAAALVDLGLEHGADDLQAGLGGEGFNLGLGLEEHFQQGQLDLDRRRSGLGARLSEGFAVLWFHAFGGLVVYFSSPSLSARRHSTNRIFSYRRDIPGADR
jgi:hypothetical protein